MGAVSDTKRRGNATLPESIPIDPDQPIDVDLYVCEVCRKNGVKTVGKLPQNRSTKYAAACTGPADRPHKQAWMQPRPFLEQVE